MATKAKINKTAQQINTILTKADNIVTDGNGEKYLGDDGAYHNIPSGSGNAGTSIDDTATSQSTTWSSSKIASEISSAIGTALGGDY